MESRVHQKLAMLGWGGGGLVFGKNERDSFRRRVHYLFTQIHQFHCVSQNRTTPSLDV